MQIKLQPNESRIVQELVKKDPLTEGVISTPLSDIDRWVDDNIKNLADVRALLKLILKLIREPARTALEGKNVARKIPGVTPINAGVAGGPLGLAFQKIRKSIR